MKLLVVSTLRSRLALALYLALFSSLRLFAAQVQLGWDPSPDATITGYRVHHGASSGNYSTSIDVGLTTTTTVTDLDPGQCYFFVVTAYNALGLESGPSNEVRCDIPNPTAEDLDLSTPEDTPLSIALGDSNPTATESMIYQLVAQPTSGSLIGDLPNTTYVPHPNYHGPDQFAYTTSQGTATSEVAVVTLTILPVNDAPVAYPSSFELLEDSTLSLTVQGLDIDGDPLSYLLVSSPLHGTLSGEFPNLIYTPLPDFHGKDQFIFTASDGSLASEPAVVSLSVLPVNDAPRALPAQWTLTQGESLPFTLQATDIDGDTLQFLVESMVSNGSLQGNPPDLTYTPLTSFTGVDTLLFSVTDPSGAQASAIITFTVAPKYTVPTAFPQEITLDEDTQTPVVLSGFLPESNKISYRIVRSPTNGRLSGTAPNLTYSPKVNVNGPDSFEFTISDGITTSEPAVVHLNILPVNDAPYGRDRTVSATEDRTVAISLTAKDIDNETLTTRIIEAPVNGYFTEVSGNTYYYRGHSDFHGSDRFTYAVSDGLLESPAYEVSITVKSVNDRPVALAQSVSAPINLATPIELKGYDVENDPLTFSISRPTYQGTLSGSIPNLVYTPFPNAKGTDSFRFRVNDGALTSLEAVVSITLTPPATSPIAQPDNLIVLAGSSTSTLLSGESSLLANDASDPSIASTTSLVTPPTHGAVELQPDGTFTYHHFGGSLASDSFSYRASNPAGQSEPTLVEVNVLGVTTLRTEANANTLDFPVVQNLTYRVEYQDLSLQSSGLWAPLTEFTADANGIATVSDPYAYLVPQRFYRLACSGPHGQLVTEPWTRHTLTLSTHPTTPSHAFEGSLVRRTTVLATAPNALQLQGPLPTQGSLDPSNGFATHLIKVVHSASPNVQGRIWRIAGQSDHTIALLTGATDLSSLLQPGDVVEIRRLATVADLIASTPISDGDVLVVQSTQSSTWTAEWVAGSGFWVTADGEQTGPHQASELTLLPNPTLTAHTISLQPLFAEIAGPAPLTATLY